MSNFNMESLGVYGQHEGKARRWMRRTLQLVVVCCLSVLPFAVAAVAQDIGSNIAPSHARLVDGGSSGAVPRIVPLPTLCDGVNDAVAAGSGLDEVLRSRGLTDQVPHKAASRLERLGTVRCYSDNLAGKIAIVLLNQSQGSGIAISNDSSWVSELDIPPSDHGTKVIIDIVDNTTNLEGQSVSVDSLLAASTRGEEQ